MFALSVLFGHSFPITGNGFDPLSMVLMPFWIGKIAVDGFFVISGFLVTASFVNRGPTEYAISRIARLYPAVIVYCILSIIIIGPLETSVPLHQYFEANPWNNMWNATLWNWTYNLPYVFTDRTFSGATNGSTWTLPVEVRCYLLVFVIGLVGIYNHRIRANVVLGIALACTLYFYYTKAGSSGQTANFNMALECFVVGSLFWVNREQIVLNAALATVAVCLPIIAARMHSPYLYHVYAICLAYLVFFIVYRTPWINLDRFGDPSYGIYIYAWPIQQMVWHKAQSGYANALLACAAVVPIAFASWFAIERPALRVRRYPAVALHDLRNWLLGLIKRHGTTANESK